MSQWTDAVDDVRKVMSDQDNDKLRYEKKVIGHQDGVNLNFKTFEMRRITSFLGAPVFPVGVYVDGVLTPATAEDLESGAFQLATAPTDGQRVVATYYVRWFTDAELEEFLETASEWLGFAGNILDIPVDLRPAAREYAAFQGYQKLVSKFAENLSETYQLYDAEDKDRFNPVDVYMKIAKTKYDLAHKLRDSAYEGKGQQLKPLSSTIRGRVRDVPPNR